MRFLVLAFIFVGCTNKVIDTPLYDSRPPAHQILIESPPSRVIYVGTVSNEGRALIRDCLANMNKSKYHKYKFNESTTFMVGSSNKRCEKDSDKNTLEVSK